ncbi:Gfo/Idh/MocA family oxidoreductase [Pelagibacteraceae bacterium]|nr:Gfo/Idh/MocA family oxidoreductase [Pelagibacteraceae bacterium]
MSNKVLNVSIVGAGYMAEEYLKVLSDLPEYNVIGIFSRSINKCKKLKKKYKSLIVFDSIQNMQASSKSDLLIVTCSAESTRIVAEDVTKYPWTILFEKPIGLGIKEYEEINKLCLERNCKAYVALNRRYYSSTEKLIEMLGQIDSPRFIEINDQENIDADVKKNRNSKVVENWMFGNSIHLIDYIDLLCRGSLYEIKIMNSWNFDNPNLVSARLFFNSGDIADYKAIWNAPAPWGVRVFTKDKYFISQPIENLSFIDKSSRQLINIDSEEVDKKYKPGLYRILQEMTKCLNGQLNKLVSVDENKNTMQYINKIYEK